MVFGASLICANHFSRVLCLTVQSSYASRFEQGVIWLLMLSDWSPKIQYISGLEESEFS